MKRVNAVSALHGHTLSIEWDPNSKLESRWYVGSQQAPAELEETRPWENRLRLPIVAELLLEAVGVDHRHTDMPYMPFPHTTLKEAIQHLSHQGRVGIQGGFLYWHESAGIFTCSTLSQEEPPMELNWQEVAELLRANYKLME